MDVAPSSRLGGYRDSGDDKAPLETGTGQTAPFTSSAGLQLGEDLREESWFAVDSQHFGAQSVDDQQATIPELVLAVLDEEWLQGITNLVAHVAIAQVEARQDRRLKFPLGSFIPVHQFSHQHVHEHYVGGIDESDILPALKQETSVDGSEPHNSVGGLEVS